MKKYFLLPLLVICPLVSAQSVEQIEEIIVTASPLGLTQEHLAGSINLIDQGELQRSAASNLGEALNGQLGVSSSSFGPGVGSPIIRGQSGKRVQVLNDGARVADVSDTSADHAIASEISQVRQVEVIRGPATLRYGSGAIGGVVNLVERIPGDTVEQGASGSVAAIYNNNSDAQTLDANTRYGVGQFEFSAAVTDRQSGNISIPGFADLEADDADETTDGYIENTDAESRAYGAGLRWQSDALEWGVELKQLDNQYGVPPGAHGHAHGNEHVVDTAAAEEFVRIDMDQKDVQSYLRFDNPTGFLDSLEIEFSTSEYQHTEIEIEDGVGTPGTYFSKDYTELSVEAVHPLGNWQSYSGVSLTADDFVAIGAEAFVPPSETSAIGAYWVQHRDFAKAIFEIGGRFDNQKIKSSGISSIEDSSLNLSTSLLYPLGEETQVGFILSRSERAPSAEELLSDGEHIATNAYEIGDPSLDSEVANNLELTYRYEGDFSAQASVFYNDFESYLFEYDTELLFNHDLADLGATGLAACSSEADFDDPLEAELATECFQYRQEGAQFFGVEAELVFAIGDRTQLRIWADQVRAMLDRSGDVPRMPPTRVGATWIYENENWYSSLALLQAADQVRPGENQEATDGYTKVDAYLGYRLDNWDIYARGNNLLNEDIRNSSSFLREIAPEAGRSAILGVRYHF